MHGSRERGELGAVGRAGAHSVPLGTCTCAAAGIMCPMQARTGCGGWVGMLVQALGWNCAVRTPSRMRSAPSNSAALISTSLRSTA